MDKLGPKLPNLGEPSDTCKQFRISSRGVRSYLKRKGHKYEIRVLERTDKDHELVIRTPSFIKNYQSY